MHSGCTHLHMVVHLSPLPPSIYEVSLLRLDGILLASKLVAVVACRGRHVFATGASPVHASGQACLWLLPKVQPRAVPRGSELAAVCKHMQHDVVGSCLAS